MRIQIAIALSLLCAFATNLAFLYKHRGAVAAPAVDIRHPLRSAADLFRSKWFALGMGIAVLAWGFHVAALAIAPLSLVQAVIAGGLVWLAVLAERVFGLTVGPRQWAGVVLTAIGLSLLAVTVPHAPGASGYSQTAMIAFEAGLVAVGATLALSASRGESAPHHGLLLGAASGVLFGVSDIAIKAATGAGDPAALFGVWVPLALVASFGAFFASARGLQKGEAVPVITLTASAANVSAIAGGILVFGDPLATNPLALVAQLAALTLVIAAAALAPAPLRAAHAA